MRLALVTLLVGALAALPRGAAADPAPAAADLLARATFARDQAMLGPAAISEVDRAAKWLRAHPQHRIVLAGHTEHSGPKAYDQDLATRRVQSIRNHLMSWGVASDRIVLVVYGDDVSPGAVPDRRVVMTSTTRPVKDVVVASLAEQRRAMTAVWTEHGTLFREHKARGDAPAHETVATRP